MKTEIIEYLERTKVDNQSEMIPIELVCQVFGISFKHHVESIKVHPSLNNEAKLVSNKSLFGDDRKRFHLTKKGFTIWLLSIDYKLIKGDNRERFVHYQYGILDYLYDTSEARAQILKRKAELKTKADAIASKLLEENAEYQELVDLRAAIARTGNEINQLDGIYYNQQLELFSHPAEE